MRLVALVLFGLLASGASLTCLAADDTSRLEVIRTRGLLKVCFWPDYYGVSYRNPKTLSLTGIDIEMAKALANDLDVAVHFVESSFATLTDDIDDGRCDVAMFAVGITPERARQVAFTDPYMASDVYAITTNSNRRIHSWADIDQPDVVVAVIRGTVHESIMRERLQQATLRVLDTPHAREQDVQSGRADVFMTDYPYSRRLLETSDWARVIEPEGVYHVTRYAYALPKDDPRWQARLQAFVRSIKRDGRLLAAARRHHLAPIVLLESPGAAP